MNEIINEFLKNGYLLSPELAKTLKNSDYKEFLSKINKEKSKSIFLNEDIKKILDVKNGFVNINWNEFDKARVLFEKQKEKNIYQLFLNILNQEFDTKVVNEKENNYVEEIDEPEEENSLIILRNYDDLEKKRDVESFTNYFRIRYETLKNILVNRPELQNTISINRLYNKSEYEKVVVIGIVSDKRTTKNGNILLTLEDPTGIVNAVFNKNRLQLFI